MSNITHPELVRALKKTGADVLKELTPHDVSIWDNSSCICGEAGELFDAIKRRVFYRKELDMVNVIEELGDIEFYLEALRVSLGVTREQCLESNIAKLSKRYEDLKYSDRSAQERADKVNKVHPKVVPATDFMHMREKAAAAQERSDRQAESFETDKSK